MFYPCKCSLILKADRPHPRNGQTDRQTNGRMDGRYQVHYLPRFAVDNNAVYFLYSMGDKMQLDMALLKGEEIKGCKGT